VLRKFASGVDQADVAVINYAGHGLEIAGVNYLIPVDAKLASDCDAEDEAVRLDRVISSADGASKLGVIILDACRHNPFPRHAQGGLLRRSFARKWRPLPSNNRWAPPSRDRRPTELRTVPDPTWRLAAAQSSPRLDAVF
jgi:hypothetical protein